jgi:phosphoglycerol transferase MdoB-like AlkP superfamily enzyme
MASLECMLERPDLGTIRRLFWAAVWLAVALVATKSYYLGVPSLRLTELDSYPRSLAAISYGDVLFVAALWAVARAAIALAGHRPLAVRIVSLGFAGAASCFCLYAVANVLIFGVFGGFLTYPLLALVGDVRMVRSSVGAHVTPAAVCGLVGLPFAYLAAFAATTRWLPVPRRVWVSRGITAGLLIVWAGVGHETYSVNWRSRPDRRIAANAQWVFLTSWWQAVSRDGIVRMPDQFPPTDLADFEPVGKASALLPTAIRRASAALGGRVVAVRRPPNVILVVLESVAARWTGLNGGPYQTTPTLGAESARSIVFNNAYAHIGRSSNSLVAMLLSTYPKLDFREITEQFPDLPGTSLAAVFRDRGYRTAFMTPSDMSWAGWHTFLDGRGFADIRDYHDLSTCPELLSSWGVEDRCMVDAMVDFVEKERSRPFFLMAWTTQTHHPYDMSPGVPELNLLRESTPDDWELGHYLNIVHETDHQLARLFDAVRRTGLEQDTLIVVTGDHGQAFGYPHENVYIQGRTAYEEDVRVPLMFWFPRTYRSAVRSTTIAGHVDLAPTIAEIAGVPAAPDWQGRSLFDTRQPHRAYFYVAEDSFTLGVREGSWKYIYDLRDGTEQLYDLDRDPNEQHNLAGNEPERCARLRQRLAAWTEANRRQYEKIAGS